MTLKELMAARKAKADAMRALIASAGENGMNAEQQAEFDKLEAEAKQLLKTIESAQAVEALHASTGRQTEPGSAAPMRWGQIEVGADRATLDPWAGFSGGCDFYRAVANAADGSVDPRLAGLRSAAGATSHGENSQDGYLAPSQISGDVLTTIEEMELGEDLVSLCDREPTSAALVEFDRDEYLPWTSGEVTAKRRDEGDTMTSQQTKKPGKAQLKPEALYVMVDATDELLADAPRMMNRLTVKSANAIVHKLNTEVLEGTGVGQFSGILTSANGALITIAKESGQTNATVLKANLDKMYNQISPRAKRRGFWMCGAGVLTAIESIYQANTNLFMPAGGLQSQPLAVLRGRPVIESEYLPELGAANDLVFIDFGAYKVIQRTGLEMAQSMHIYFDKGKQAFRWTLRNNGMPRLSSTIARNKAASYPVSPFIALGARTS